MLIRRLVLAAQLLTDGAGALVSLVCVSRMTAGSFGASTTTAVGLVLAPFVAAALLATMAHRCEWSMLFSVTLLVANISVAALSCWAYASVAYGSHHSSTEGLICLDVPIFSLVIGGGLVFAIFGGSRLARFVAGQ